MQETDLRKVFPRAYDAIVATLLEGAGGKYKDNNQRWLEMPFNEHDDRAMAHREKWWHTDIGGFGQPIGGEYNLAHFLTRAMMAVETYLRLEDTTDDANNRPVQA